MSGNWSVMLPTNGGSTALALARGVVAVMPDADILLTGWVRTRGLRNARARVVARLLDDKLEVVEGAEYESGPAVSPLGWSFLRVDVRGREEAAWIQVELQLLQPDQLEGVDPAEGEFHGEDTSGAAWFDDIRLYQAPRIDLRTDSPTGVHIAPGTPTVELGVQDLAGDALRVELVAVSWDGAVVDRLSAPIASDGTPTVWTPALPAYGWYRAIARIYTDRGAVAQGATDFAWLVGSGGDRPVSPAFGVAIGDDPAERLDALPALVGPLGVGAATIDVWSRSTRQGDAVASADGGVSPREATERVFEKLLDMGLDLTFVLDRAPRRLAANAQVDADEVLRLLSSGDGAWLEDLRPLLSRFGERVRRWQVGRTGSDEAFHARDLADRLGVVRDALFRLIPRPIVVAPWPAHGVVGSDLPPETAITAHTSAATPSGAMPMVVSSVPEGVDATVLLEPMSAQRFGVRAHIRETAKRTIRAWAGGAWRIAIPAPWRWTRDEASPAAPTPAYPVWRTLVASLAGRSLVGQMPVSAGAVALLAGDGGSSTEGAIIAWNEVAPAGEAVIDGYLGDGPVVVRDLFGNTREVVADEDGERHIPLSDLPIIVEGVDLDLLQFRSTLRLEPDFIETRAREHTVELVITNPWNAAMGGRLWLDTPESWRVSPRVIDVAVPAGGEQRAPLSVAFGLNETAGPRTIHAEVQLSADRTYPTVRLPIEVELGLRHLRVVGSYRFVDGPGGRGSDLILTVLVSNLGSAEVSLDAQVLAAGYAGQESVVHALAPGETTLRRFRFDNARDQLTGERIRVSMRERNGAGRINQWVDVR